MVRSRAGGRAIGVACHNAWRPLALVVLLAGLAPLDAQAQGTVQQLGAVTKQHLAMYAGDGRIMDAGGVPAPGQPPENQDQPGTLPSGLGIVNSGLGYAAFSGYANAAYSRFLLGFDGSGNARIKLDRIGGGLIPTLTCEINGIVSTCLSGSVSSIGLSGPGGIFGVTGTPVTTSGTLGLTITGTAGGLPYFSGASTLSSSGSIIGLVLNSGASGPAPYAGTSCTNQFPRSLNASGVAACATVGASDVALANLSAADGTLTFSGTYNGSTARTVGLNLSNRNSWLAPQRAAQGSVAISTATFTPDLNAAQHFTLTLVNAACPCTVANPSNSASAAGQVGMIRVVQSATGSDTLTWGSNWKFAGGTEPTLSTGPNAQDYFAYYVFDSTTVIVSAGVLNAQ